MTAGYHALTEKEKQTLRLLLGGHDAKSIARHLGLSVHTIHERLREARRKLGTASSREAARMLQELEGSPPQFVGDKAFGDAPGDTVAESDVQPAQPGKTLPMRGWIIGGLAMTISLFALALSSLGVSGLAGSGGPALAITAEAPATVAPTPASEAAAVASARAFLALLDRDDWAASWRATHKSFQLLNTVDWWAQASQKVRARVGAVKSRELATVNFTAAPPAGYWIVSFKARYSLQVSVTETLHLAYEDGTWKVSSIIVE